MLRTYSPKRALEQQESLTFPGLTGGSDAKFDGRRTTFTTKYLGLTPEAASDADESP